MQRSECLIHWSLQIPGILGRPFRQMGHANARLPVSAPFFVVLFLCLTGFDLARHSVPPNQILDGGPPKDGIPASCRILTRLNFLLERLFDFVFGPLKIIMRLQVEPELPTRINPLARALRRIPRTPTASRGRFSLGWSRRLSPLRSPFRTASR